MRTRRLLPGACACAGALLALACDGGGDEALERLVASVQRACAEKDAGFLLSLADRDYADELGGVGRLGDDLANLFAVYGGLRLEVAGLARTEDGWVRGRAVLVGRALRFEGPLAWQLRAKAVGTFVASGLLTELRGVLYALRLRRLAVENADLERLDEVVSMEYRGAGGDREALLERTRAALALRQGSAWIVKRLGIAVDRETARVDQEVVWVAREGGRSVEREDRERLTLRHEGSRWRIVDGLG